MRSRLVAIACLLVAVGAPSSDAAVGRCAVNLSVAPVVYADPASALAAVVPAAQRSARRHRVPVSVTLAQFALESGWGRFGLEANNFFGIKAQRVVPPGGSPSEARTRAGALRRTYSWGDVAVGCVIRRTTEYVEVRRRGKRVEKPITVWAAFRGYRSPAGSIEDHARFFVENPRYAPAFAHVDDPERFARAVARAGYATDPKYASKLVSLIRSEDLTRYDVPLGTP